MDWNSEQGWTLLRQAYPEGHLITAHPHATVGGWTKTNRFWIPPTGDPCEGRISHPQVAAALVRGDLLPRPVPTDITTWVVLLTDLAHAAGVPNRPDSPNHGFCWTQLGEKEREESGGAPPGWRLTVAESFGYTDRVFYNIDTDDAAEALVQARILLRAEEK